jgi:hypothetical protein
VEASACGSNGRAWQGCADAMLNDLELNGVTFGHRSYTLQEIQSALGKIGHDGTILLMQRLKKARE